MTLRKIVRWRAAVQSRLEGTAMYATRQATPRLKYRAPDLGCVKCMQMTVVEDGDQHAGVARVCTVVCAHYQISLASACTVT